MDPLPEHRIAITRRHFFGRAGVGMAALAALLDADRSRAAEGPAGGLPHFPPKAKNVIFLFMHGGVSHVDTFDPKPSLRRFDGQPLPGSFGEGLITSRIDFRKALMRGSPWEFHKCGKSGLFRRGNPRQ